MPELPEVETVVRDLSRLLPGATVERVEVVHADLLGGVGPEEFAAAVRGRTVRGVGRRAKNILIELGGVLLAVNLGMTGRLLVLRPDDPPPSHPGVRFGLDDGRRLVYHDVRRFGSVEALAPAAWAERERRLGPEPLGPDFTVERLHQLTRGSRVAIKTWIMDQRRVVGVGNIYASEALWRARITPRRQAKNLSRAHVERLHAGIQSVLREAIEFRGTTFLDYRDASGERGGFVDRLAVYDRAGLPCRRCGTAIRRIVQGGRSTFYCPECQR